MQKTTLTSKGQITIPKPIRESLHLHSGDKIEFILTQKNEVLLRPVTKKVDDLFGILHKPGRKSVTVEQMDAAIKQKIKDEFQ
ncbi:MAG TPA: AbrB/MazE/SpoVT family DNA-binding domain-containing protein [Chromatiales bacterium]|nr:AbrB/MazE/SpoVT family DNA-binding domain-containing protein [Thiotrichales bacterium]HIP67829.1 AbrB/MazE/SpoVT family DNA-binding domain-containing protein [Chromatiales bacterium]